jgi:hypothetical protein
LTEGEKSKRDAQVNTSQHEQYGSIVHLFIGTGRNPIKITFLSFTTNYNHDINYHGFMGRSVFSSLSRCNPSSQDVPLYRSSLEADPSKVFLLTGPSAKKQTPNSSFIKSHPSRMPFSFSSCTLFGEPIKFSLHRHCPHTCALLALTLLPSTSLHRHGSDAPTL